MSRRRQQINNESDRNHKNLLLGYKGNKKASLEKYPHYNKTELRDALVKAGKTGLRYSGKDRAFYHD